MKTFKQKTLSLALFGLLAMNSGYSLLSQNENNYEGSAMLASSSQDSLEDTLRKLEKLDSDVKVKANSSDTSRFVYKVENFSELDDDEEQTLWNLIGMNGSSWKNIKVKTTGKDLYLTLYKTEIVDAKSQRVKLNGQSAKIKGVEFADTNESSSYFGGSSSKVNYRVNLDTEGLSLDGCDTCLEELESVLVPIDQSQTGSLTDIMAAIQANLDERVKSKKDEIADEKAEAVAQKKRDNERLCLTSSATTRLSKSQLSCMVKRLEDKDDSVSFVLTGKEKDRLRDILKAYVKAEYKDDKRSDRFDDYLKGNPDFVALHNTAKKEAIKEVAKEEKYERERERTEWNEEALQADIEWLEDSIYEWDSLQREFENLHNYATRDLENRKWQCDSYMGYYPGRQSSYFGNTYSAGFSITPRDGFQTWSGQGRGRALTSMPGVNMMGGNNQFYALQQQNAQMMRNNCMQNVQTAQNYWDWELNALERNSIEPLGRSISQNINRLDINRIFPTTYKLGAEDNGGLLLSDKKYYESVINGLQQDLNAMGYNSQTGNNRGNMYRMGTQSQGRNLNRGNNYQQPRANNNGNFNRNRRSGRS